MKNIQVVAGFRERDGEGGGCGYNTVAGETLVMNYFASDCGSGHTHLYVTKLQGTKLNACKTGEIQRKSMDCINFNLLVVMLYYSYAKCYHGGELGAGSTTCIISYNCTQIYKSQNKKKIKETLKRQ